MLFFFKKKKLVIDAFCSKSFGHAYDYAPIDYAHNFYPDWWKNLPKIEVAPEKFGAKDINNLNMRLCGGIVDHYKRGFILPMWTDFYAKSDSTNTYSYQFSDSKSSCAFHPISQRKGFYEDHTNMKIISPWLLESEKDVYFTVMPAIWNHTTNPGYILPIGTLNFYNQKALNINFFIKPPKEILIPFRQPVLHIMPLTDREIVIKNHLISDDDWHRKRSERIAFYGTYFKTKKYDDNKESSKCPFHNMKIW
jgi:hypothetical protein